MNKYGEQTTSVIDTSLKKIGENVKNKKNWGSIVFYPDDEECTKSLGLEKIEELDPWSIKLALIDLESSLSKKRRYDRCRSYSRERRCGPVPSFT